MSVGLRAACKTQKSPGITGALQCSEAMT